MGHITRYTAVTANPLRAHDTESLGKPDKNFKGYNSTKYAQGVNVTKCLKKLPSGHFDDDLVCSELSFPIC